MSVPKHHPLRQPGGNVGFLPGRAPGGRVGFLPGSAGLAPLGGNVGFLPGRAGFTALGGRVGFTPFGVAGFLPGPGKPTGFNGTRLFGIIVSHNVVSGYRRKGRRNVVFVLRHKIQRMRLSDHLLNFGFDFA